MYDWAELRHFRYLLTILERQGFRVAAEELHTSQPNLSVQARQFQENASVRLYKKLKNGRIRPTETGLAFIALAKLLLETRDEVINALVAIERGEIGSVRFGCTPLVDQSLFRSFCAMHKEILPACAIRPTHGDTVQLAEEVLAGAVDAAIVTLPLKHAELHIEEIRRDRLVVCLRRDNALTTKAALQPTDLQDNLGVLYHPQRHPDAHERLLEWLADAGVRVKEYSRASHPSEMQMLVKDGHGFTLIREGSTLDEELTTRPIAGVDWTVDTAVIYHKLRHPKTVPLLVRKLGSTAPQSAKETKPHKVSVLVDIPKRPPQPVMGDPVQLTFFREAHEQQRNGTG
ncbi:LysR family transcriptional regulator [Tunturiibacter empetritectus]|uniref:LysR family transcriptional regulator n=1 Tax=Tunturiibacter empetritectus TaxID=3069691 RepID=UPI003D9AD792